MYGGTKKYPDDEEKQIAYNDGWMDASIHHKFKHLEHEDGMILGIVLGFLIGAASVVLFIFATGGAACNFIQPRKPSAIIRQQAPTTYYYEMR